MKFSRNIQRLLDAAERDERRQRRQRVVPGLTGEQTAAAESSVRFASRMRSRRIIERARVAKDKAAERSLQAQAEAAARYARLTDKFERVRRINADPKVRAAVEAYKQAEAEWGELLAVHMGYD